MSQRLKEPSKQTVWKFTWSCWTTSWIKRSDSRRSDLWVPSLSALLTQSLSAETESMGFPIHLSTHISSASNKGIIMSLINCESILFKFVWTTSGKAAGVCFHSYCQMLWPVPKWLAGNMVAIQQFVVQIRIWCHYSLRIYEVGPDRNCSFQSTPQGQEEKKRLWICKGVRKRQEWSQTESPRQWPRAWASGSDLDKEGERRSSSSEAKQWSTWS